MKKTKALIGTVLAFALPVLASAQTINSVQSLIVWIMNAINHIAIPFIFTLSFVVFIWGVFQTFILGRGNEEKAQEGRNLVIWGIVGFFVMIAIWGLVNIALGTFNLQNSTPQLPQSPYQAQ